MKTQLTAHVLEVHERKKDEKTYYSLVCYEPGQQYPELKKANINPELLSMARSLEGKFCELQFDVRMGRDYVSLVFLGGRERLQKAA